MVSTAVISLAFCLLNFEKLKTFSIQGENLPWKPFLMHNWTGFDKQILLSSESFKKQKFLLWLFGLESFFKLFGILTILIDNDEIQKFFWTEKLTISNKDDPSRLYKIVYRLSISRIKSQDPTMITIKYEECSTTKKNTKS